MPYSYCKTLAVENIGELGKNCITYFPTKVLCYLDVNSWSAKFFPAKFLL